MGILGFTGTRAGMTYKQTVAVTGFLTKIDPGNAVHGDCTGADEDFDNICKALGIFREVFPGKNNQGDSPNRAFCDAEIIHPVLPYLVRDRIIVEKAKLGLIACPKGKTEERRSGTWTTVRYARNMLRPIYIIFPDGTYKLEGLQNRN